jgi:predicted 3-demethylubiquinone-9 3-methyltransferase (glyoxalase superfamily)
MEKITPNLWFDEDAEAAAEFYVSLFPDSRIDAVHRSAGDNPGKRLCTFRYPLHCRTAGKSLAEQR